MKKVKLDSKSEKFDDAFFTDENSGENAALSSAQNAKISEIEKETDFTGGQKSLITLLKQVFLFLPGAFLAFFASYGAGIIFMEIVVYRRPFEALPDDYPFQFAQIGSIILLGALMSWLGLGDIKNKKHFAIPASIIITGALIGAIVKAASRVFDLADKMLDDFSYLIYLLPLVFIIPVLTKSVVERKTEDAHK